MAPGIIETGQIVMHYEICYLKFDVYVKTFQILLLRCAASYNLWRMNDEWTSFGT